MNVCCSLKSEPNEKVFFDEELNAFAWWGREIINLPVCCSVDLKVARSGLEKEIPGSGDVQDCFELWRVCWIIECNYNATRTAIRGRNILLQYFRNIIDRRFS